MSNSVKCIIESQCAICNCRGFCTYKETANRGKELIEKAYRQGWLDGSDFSILIQRLLVSENGYVINTGTWKNANAEIALLLAERIKKHPILWKLFFMVA